MNLLKLIKHFLYKSKVFKQTPKVKLKNKTIIEVFKETKQ